jgi:hypothetical protein
MEEKLRQYNALLSITKEPSVPMINQISGKCAEIILTKKVLDLSFTHDGIYQFKSAVVGGDESSTDDTNTTTIGMFEELSDFYYDADINI